MNLTPFSLFLAIAIGAIVIELLVFQLSLFWLFFVGLAALLVAVASLFIHDLSWAMAFAIFTVALVVVTIAGYRPLKKWQQSGKKVDGNTAIGQQVKVLESIAVGSPGKVFWSGTDWVAELTEGHTDSIEAESLAIITAVEGIRLQVKPL